MTAYLGIGLPGGYEIWVILLIVLLLFGHRLPGMARSLGSGITEFKKGLKGNEEKGSSSNPTDSNNDDSSTKN